MDIDEFIAARLDEDQAAAEAWQEDRRTWQQVGDRHLRYDNGCRDSVQAIDVSGRVALWDESIWVKYDYDGKRAAHIARHDPNRVLAEVAALRRIVGLHDPELIEATNADGDEQSGHFCRLCDEPSPCDTVKLLAAPYAAHPDYDPTWSLT